MQASTVLQGKGEEKKPNKKPPKTNPSDVHSFGSSRKGALQIVKPATTEVKHTPNWATVTVRFWHMLIIFIVCWNSCFKESNPNRKHHTPDGPYKVKTSAPPPFHYL